jgi:hypothetical protein
MVVGYNLVRPFQDRLMVKIRSFPSIYIYVSLHGIYEHSLCSNVSTNGTEFNPMAVVEHLQICRICTFYGCRETKFVC